MNILVGLGWLFEINSRICCFFEVQFEVWNCETDRHKTGTVPKYLNVDVGFWGHRGQAIHCIRGPSRVTLVALRGAKMPAEQCDCCYQIIEGERHWVQPDW